MINLPPVLEVFDPKIGTNRKESVDWKSVLEATVFHGIFPLAHLQCSASEPAQIPREFLWQLTAYTMQNAERCRQLRTEWLEILELFHSSGIPVMPVKGFWLAEFVYGDSSLRSFTDLDYFVKECDLDRCGEMLESAGYHLQYTRSKFEKKTRANHHEVAFMKNGTLLELQYRFAPGFLSLNIEEEDVWDRAQPILIDNIPAFRMSAEDTFLYLCVHAWKHRWSRFKWICDVAQFLTLIDVDRTDSFRMDWDAVIERARRSRIERILIDTLLLTKNFLHPPFPENVIAELEKTSSSALGLDCGIPLDFRSKWDEFRHWVTYRPHLSDRIKMSLAFLQPSDTDFQLIPLPQSLYFIYYFLRPFLLTRKLLFMMTNRNGS